LGFRPKSHYCKTFWQNCLYLALVVGLAQDCKMKQY
jgi:hypothetical protein